MNGVHSLLVRVCHREAGPGLTTDQIKPIADPEFRRRFLGGATRHGVLGLSLDVLATHPAARDEPYGRVLHRMRETQRHRAAVLDMKRDMVLSVLRQGGIEPLVLKGAAMVGREYEDPVQRDLLDLDLLLTRDDTDTAVGLLRGRGYRPPEPRSRLDAYRRRHFHIQMHHEDSHCVELHWDLSMPDSPFRLSPERVLQEARRLELKDRPVILVPRAEHLVLHVVLQNLQEGFSRLARAVDVDRILIVEPSFDWDELVTEARRGKLGHATALTLQLARRFLDSPVPEDVVRRLSPSPLSRAHLALMDPPRFLLHQECLRVAAARDLADFWLADDWGARVDILRGLKQQGFRSGAEEASRPSTWHGTSRLIKLTGRLLWLYGRALATAPRHP
jgi:hypothetical protein